MNLSQLRYFDAIVRTGSISRAAEQLYVTQPSISKGIINLEDELGVALFERRKGRLILNEHGRSFYGYVMRAINELDKGIALLDNVRRELDTSLIISAPAGMLVDPMIRAFYAKYPQLRLTKHAYFNQGQEDRLIDGTLDCAFFTKPVSREDIRAEQIAAFEVVALVSEDHALAGQSFIHLSQLQNEHFICDVRMMDEQTTKQLCQPYGFTPQIYHILETVSLAEDFLRNTDNIMVVPSNYYFAPANDGILADVHLLRFYEPLPSTPVWMAVRGGIRQTPVCQNFCSFARSFFRKEEEQIRKRLDDTCPRIKNENEIK